MFWTLAAAALLTAFYTFRIVFLTFFGKPRTEAAAHAPESVNSMTLSLMVLAFFAVVLGWIGIPESWTAFGPAAANPLGDYLGVMAETYHLHYEALPFLPIPVLVSVSVALGGIFFAWLVYGRKPLQAGQQDPLVRWLGPVHTVLKNKYYFDEFYDLIAVRPTLWLARAVYWFDQHVIDFIVNTVGRFGRWVARFTRTAIDEWFIDGAVNGTGLVASTAGSMLRLVQSGQIQQYLLVMLLTVLILIGVAEIIFW